MNRLAEMVGLAPEGGKIVFGFLALALIVMLAGFHLAAGFLALVALGLASFFRDPERLPERTEGVVLAAADGKVTGVCACALPGGGDAGYHRVSVFMSPLNVHVNRAPVQGEVLAVEHTPGRLRAAYRDDASVYNERNLIVVRDDRGQRHGIMQVAGYLARRIVCRVRARDRIAAGQRIGLIMFGSRVDHFIPADFRVTVRAGERVRAGVTVMGELAR